MRADPDPPHSGGRSEQTSPHARRGLPSDGSAEKTAADYADKPLRDGRGHDEKDTRGRVVIGWLGEGGSNDDDPNRDNAALGG